MRLLEKTIESRSAVFFFVCTSVVEIDLSSAERTWAEIFMKSAERMYEKVCKNLRLVFTNFLFYTYVIYYLYYLCIYTIYLYIYTIFAINYFTAFPLFAEKPTAV